MTDTQHQMQRKAESRVRVGLVVALPIELGPFQEGGERLSAAASDRRAPRHTETFVRSHPIAGSNADALVLRSGIGKVRAAHAATVLAGLGVDILLGVGTAGGLTSAGLVGDLVLVREAVQWDLAVRGGRSHSASEDIVRAWQQATSAQTGVCLTADRPALRHSTRARHAWAARALTVPGEPLVADMETAAVAEVASREGLPWAALRVISDARLAPWKALRRSQRAAVSFEVNAERVAGIPASTVPSLCRALYPDVVSDS